MMKVYNVVVDHKVSGTGFELVKLLMTKNFFEKYDSVEDYLERLPKDVWRLYNKSIAIDKGKPIEEQCDQFISQMINQGLLEEVEEA